MKRLFTMIVLAMVLVGFSVVEASAGVKKIRPDQLKVINSTLDYIQYPQSASSADSSPCYWTAFVKLPIGSRITKLKYYHKGGVSTSQTWVKLYRVKMGEEKKELTGAGILDGTNNIIPVEETTVNLPVVKSGYSYYVHVYSENSNSHIYGIKITYQD